ncbi:MAG: hypothetical protein SV375_05195 [Thermodesulfobacteriota bacterium]|nr:hypothetical protein [Thermodesulfobacteriota bacterium]
MTQTNTDNADEILGGPDYFRCERFNTRLKKINCVRRQDGDHEIYSPYATTSEIYMSLDVCLDCEQGKEIRRQVDKKEELMENEKTKICKECSKEKPLSEFHASRNGKDGRHAKCKICRHEDYIKDREMIKSAKAGKIATQEPGLATRPHGEDRDQGGDIDQDIEIKGQMTVSLNFEGHEWIYHSLRDYAVDNLRTIEAQAIYMIREVFWKDGKEEG